jgi:predicted secreted protein
LIDGQQFHQYQQKSPLTSTHWVMVNNSTNISKHHLSPYWVEVRCDFVDIGGIVDHHSMSLGERWFLLILVGLLTINSLSDGQQFHQYQQKSPLTSTHWVMVKNSTNISKHHLSPKLIEWWSTIPPISTKITSSMS